MLTSLYIPPNKLASIIDVKKASSNQGVTRRRWAAIRNIESFYVKSLKRVASAVGGFITDLFNAGKSNQIEETLTTYSEIIEPWAEAVATKMITEVNINDQKAWLKHSGKKAYLMKEELKGLSVNEIIHELRARQVYLIKSIPLEAAQRVQDLAHEAVTVTSETWQAVAEKIRNSEQVSKSKS